MHSVIPELIKKVLTRLFSADSKCEKRSESATGYVMKGRMGSLFLIAYLIKTPLCVCCPA